MCVEAHILRKNHSILIQLRSAETDLDNTYEHFVRWLSNSSRKLRINIKGIKSIFFLGDRISNYFFEKTVYELQRAVRANIISIILLDIRALIL